MMFMAKSNKKNNRNNYKQHITVSLALLVAFLIGVSSVLSYQYVEKQQRSIPKEVSIAGTDGLMGLAGYGQPFAEAGTVTYYVTYYNQSSEDRHIHIKATRFSRDPSEDIRDPDGSLVGRVIDASFSDDEVVPAGEFRIFMLELSQSKPSTEYLELEAFKV